MRPIDADEMVRYLSWFIFGLIFLYTTSQAVRRPSRSAVDIALFFGATTVVIAVSLLRLAGIAAAGAGGAALIATALLALPYLLFRLIDDMVGAPPLLHPRVIRHRESKNFPLSLRFTAKS